MNRGSPSLLKHSEMLGPAKGTMPSRPSGLDQKSTRRKNQNIESVSVDSDASLTIRNVRVRACSYPDSQCTEGSIGNCASTSGESHDDPVPRPNGISEV